MTMPPRLAWFLGLACLINVGLFVYAFAAQRIPVCGVNCLEMGLAFVGGILLVRHSASQEIDEAIAGLPAVAKSAEAQGIAWHKSAQANVKADIEELDMEWAFACQKRYPAGAEALKNFMTAVIAQHTATLGPPDPTKVGAAP